MGKLLHGIGGTRGLAEKIPPNFTGFCWRDSLLVRIDIHSLRVAVVS
jgi:hypothetical protein